MDGPGLTKGTNEKVAKSPSEPVVSEAETRNSYNPVTQFDTPVNAKLHHSS